MSIRIETLRCFVTVVARGAGGGGQSAWACSVGCVNYAEAAQGTRRCTHFETTRKSRLTLLGLQVLDEAHREIEHFDRIVAAFDGLSNSELRQVSLTVTLSTPQSIKPPILRDFVQALRTCGSTSAARISRRSSGTSARKFLTLA